MTRAGLFGFAAAASLVLIVGLGVWYASSGAEFFPSTAAGARDLGDPGVVLTGNERRGEALYAANCSGCHGGPTGGSITDYPPRHNANGHTWHHPDCALVALIESGGDALKETTAPSAAPTMPAYAGRLSRSDIADVMAYIRLMWTPQQRSVQAQTTATQCLGR